MTPSRQSDPATNLCRLAGAAVMALTLLPLYRYLNDPATGTIGAATLRATEAQVGFLWRAGAMLLVGVALATLAVTDDRLGRWVQGAGDLLLRGSRRTFAAALGVLAAGAVALQNLLVFQGRPNLLDAAAQLIHARYLARGRLAGPEAELLEGGFWHFPNTVAGPSGWVSHFPPGHSLVLAPGLAVGVAWLGPVVVAGLTGWLMAHLAFRLFPERPLVARGGALLGALSLLLLLQTAAYMNHGTAALLGVATVVAALGARDRGGGDRAARDRGLRGSGWAWAAVTGAGVTALLMVRPLAAVAVCLVVVLLVWLPRSLLAANAESGKAGGSRPASGKPRLAGGTASHLRRLAGWCGAAVLGGLPLLLLHGWYNAHFFGHPLTFGYHWSFGEAAGLGFGLDPWGNRFGPLQSLAYTSADLSTLNLNLVESPLPVITLAGFALVLGMGRDPRVRLVAGWALLPVALGAFYWHHGNFMGPRMLAEFAPAWGLLVAAALAYLVERLPRRDGRGLAMNPRRAGQLLVLGAALAALVLVPYRMSGMGGDISAGYRVAEPAAPPGALVFVTGSWGGRITAELVSHGVPQVVAEIALRQNSTCTVEAHRRHFRQGEGPLAAYRDRSGWGEGGIPLEAARDPAPDSPLPPLDLVRRPPPYTGLQVGHVGQGSQIRYVPEEELSGACVRQIEADERGGIIDAGHLYWLGGLPGIEDHRVIYVRDMGPELNRRLLERYPDREARVFLRRDRGAPLELLDYDEAMRLMWGEARRISR